MGDFPRVSQVQPASMLSGKNKGFQVNTTQATKTIQNMCKTTADKTGFERHKVVRRQK